MSFNKSNLICKDVLFKCKARNITRNLCLRLTAKGLKVLSCPHLEERNLTDVAYDIYQETKIK